MKQRYRQAKKDYKSLKTLTATQKSQVKRIVNKRRELKYYTYTYSGISVTTTGALTGLPFDIPQGITDKSRIGDQYELCGNIDMRLQVSANDVFNQMRFIIFQWKGVSTIAPKPDITDVLLVGPSGIIDVHSSYAHDTRSSYTILFDKTFTPIGNGTANYPLTATSVINRRYLISLKKANKDVDLIAGGGQGKNRLFFFYISDSSAALHPTFTASIKTVFRDS